MAFSEGEIISSDLSPNAGILGTQIADKTLSLRNFNESVFAIVQKGTTTIPGFANASGAASMVTIAHGLSFTPLIQAYAQGIFVNPSAVSIATSYIPLPVYEGSGAVQYYFPGDGTNSYALTIIYGVDATNLYFEAFSVAPSGSINNIPITYFLLQASAT